MTPEKKSELKACLNNNWSAKITSLSFEEKMIIAKMEKPWIMQHSADALKYNMPIMKKYLEEFTTEERYLCHTATFWKKRILRRKMREKKC